MSNFGEYKMSIRSLVLYFKGGIYSDKLVNHLPMLPRLDDPLPLFVFCNNNSDLKALVSMLSTYTIPSLPFPNPSLLHRNQTHRRRRPKKALPAAPHIFVSLRPGKTPHPKPKKAFNRIGPPEPFPNLKTRNGPSVQ